MTTSGDIYAIIADIYRKKGKHAFFTAEEKDQLIGMIAKRLNLPPSIVSRAIPDRKIIADWTGDILKRIRDKLRIRYGNLEIWPRIEKDIDRMAELMPQGYNVVSIANLLAKDIQAAVGKKSKLNLLGQAAGWAHSYRGGFNSNKLAELGDQLGVATKEDLDFAIALHAFHDKVPDLEDDWGDRRDPPQANPAR